MAAAIAAVIVLGGAGCGPAADEDEGPAKPKAVTFSGQVEPKLIGTWKTKDESSVLDLGKDGQATISSTAPSPGGPMKSTAHGSWLVSDGSLLLKYAVNSQPETVIKFQYSLVGKQLTLTTSIGTKTVYAAA